MASGAVTLKSAAGLDAGGASGAVLVSSGNAAAGASGSISVTTGTAASGQSGNWVCDKFVFF